MNNQPDTIAMNGSTSVSQRNPNRYVIYGIIALVLIIVPHIMPNSYWLRIYAMSGIWIMLAL